MHILTPQNEADVLDIIRTALSEETPLELVGHGTKHALGHPVKAAHQLSFAKLSGVVSYDPAELMLTILPGTPRSEVERLLASNTQRLAFEPPHLGPLWGVSGSGTIGGLISCNLSGPRRFRVGACRDFVLAVRAVSGFGESFKAGGKVVKNVTGYDLPKLLTGAYGTLAALTEITLKVLPKPATEQTLLIKDIPLSDALPHMRALAGDPSEPTGLAYVGGDMSVRYEGPSGPVNAHIKALAAKLGGETLAAETSAAHWESLRDGSAFAGQDTELWRLSIAPTDAQKLLDEALPKGFIIDGAGGTVWLDQPKAGWQPTSGAGTCLRGLDFIAPMGEDIRLLHSRIKAQFDPKAILNPGRMFKDED